MDHYWVDEEVSIGKWVFILILVAIPIVNIITLLVLAMGKHNESLKNFAKASLILAVIGIILGLLFSF
ncbi:hypothetical protein [Piscibacillus salipiscarius]|uniref:Uncharacterized protein n=1 Tax=Piscibacillus salipiscarius TaxID=299480 RepID=A0ABW5Q761_9BACI|nr:hypothetical protein [Piscibacillus salipiscarius]